MSEYINYLWSMIFSPQDPVGFTVNMIIVSLFIIGCVDVFSSLARLTKERRSIGQARESLLDPGAICPAEPEGAVLGFLKVSKESLLGKRVARVVRLRSSGLGQRDVLQQLSVERVDGYGALARYLGMILTLLGLLGTVFGLSLALVKIQGALEGVNDVEGLSELTRALGGTLAGMKTAFGCTMAGLSTALLLSYLNHLVRRKQSGVIAELEEFIVCDLLPTLESVDPGADEAAKAFASTMKNAGAELNGVRQTIISAATEYKNGSQEMAKIAEALQAAVNAFGSAVSQVTGNQQAFTQALNETRQAVSDMAGAVTTQFAEVRKYMENSNKILEARLASMEQSTQSNLTVQQDLKTLADQFNPAIREYHDHFKSFLGESLAQFKTSMKSLLSEINEHYKDGVNSNVNNNHKAFQESLSQYASKLQGIVENNNAEIGSLFENQSSALRAFSDMIVDVNLNIHAMFDRMSDANGHSMKPAHIVKEASHETHIAQP